MRIVVDFPAPFGPRNPCTSPARTVRSRPSRARNLPKSFTGTLDDQLETASIYFDRELESRIKKFTTMFEPIMIVFVGVIVGFVAIALVSAMYGVLGGMKEGA